ncbi:STAS domain-containing protein [Actinoplanes sp. LDG1-06]|uniref:Anti-sigma factor antagonist n=1 Tax=Paractinoplanes ovalisporus TaxID=2810368 RepID=A0ABS2AGH5_9ACTN|nr:STAS domain-containing protein [Actinoplanes ovalisporus]MBM2618907.1 STAS domain-containing protein [Actinoplanes ovalisporus]
MPDEFVTSLDRSGETATVALRGEVDVLTVDQVRAALSDALATRPREIVVDLSDLVFIDSTGLGALIFGFQRARDSGVRFRLSGATAPVKQILMLSGLLEVVELTP